MDWEINYTPYDMIWQIQSAQMIYITSKIILN